MFAFFSVCASGRREDAIDLARTEPWEVKEEERVARRASVVDSLGTLCVGGWLLGGERMERRRGGHTKDHREDHRLKFLHLANGK